MAPDAYPQDVRSRTMTNGKAPVVFIHGLWLHASSWAPWLDLFTEAGYQAAAPGWPGIPDTVSEARANPDSIADHGIDAAQIKGVLPLPLSSLRATLPVFK